MKRQLLIVGVIYVLWLQSAMAQTTQPAEAVELYRLAGKAIAVNSPQSSDLVRPSYPPFGKAWDDLAAQAWTKNAEARRLAHLAMACRHADWPKTRGNMDFAYLKSLRGVANDLSDAALYQHFQGDDAGAIETIRDVLHMAKLLRDNPEADTIIRPTVAAGFDSLCTADALIIAADVKLNADPAEAPALSVATARALIADLLDTTKPEDVLAQSVGEEKARLIKDNPDVETFLETLNQANAGRTFLAMSLACHVYRLEKGRWPASLAELSPAYLPKLPLDPWGDGKQTYGYVLVKNGLPDGSDRPLVYARRYSEDGLFYRTDEPQYVFHYPTDHAKHGGWFCDVAAWVPPAGVKHDPTTRPLN